MAKLKNGYLTSGSADDTIKFWDTSSGQCLTTLTGHTSDISSLFELRSGYLASGSWDHTIKFWESKSGRLVGTIVTNHTGDVSSLVEMKITNNKLASGGGLFFILF